MLEALVPELFSQVLLFLLLPDLCSLRLTSRHLKQVTARDFATAAFSTIRIDFSTANLQWAQNIASYDDFRSAVRTLRVGKWAGKVTGARSSQDISYGHGGQWPRLDSRRVDCASDYVQKFVHCVSRFPNCTGVVVTDERTALPHYPDYRGRDRHLSSADAVDLVLHALSAREAPALRKIRTRISHGIDWYPPGLISKTAVAEVRSNVVEHLEDLTLELRVEDEESTASLLQLLTRSPGLTTLRLMLDCGEPVTDGLTASPLSHCLDSLPHFSPRLDILFLGNLKLSETGLLRLLSNSADTLGRLDLSEVCLTSGSWNAVLAHLQAVPFRHLQRLSMFRCSEGPSDETVAFCQLWKRQGVCEARRGSFEFRFSCTVIEPPKAYHVTGALFESSGDAAEMRMALQAIAENSHLCSSNYNPAPRCAELHDMKKTMERPYTGGITLFERWTGLSLRDE